MSYLVNADRKGELFVRIDSSSNLIAHVSDCRDKVTSLDLNLLCCYLGSRLGTALNQNYFQATECLLLRHETLIDSNKRSEILLFTCCPEVMNQQQMNLTTQGEQMEAIQSLTCVLPSRQVEIRCVLALFSYHNIFLYTHS